MGIAPLVIYNFFFLACLVSQLLAIRVCVCCLFLQFCFMNRDVKNDSTATPPLPKSSTSMWQKWAKFCEQVGDASTTPIAEKGKILI